MKHIFKYIGIIAATGFLASCSSDDDNTGDSVIDYEKVNATVTSEKSTYTFSEKGIDEADASTYQFPVTVTLDAAAPVDTYIDLELTEDSEGDASDFEAEPIVIPTGQTSASGVVSILSNMEEEGNETLKLEATSRANLNLTPFTVTVNIQDDYINDVLELTADWSGSFTESIESADISIDFCDMDFDLMILDADMNDTGLDGAATGACPESISISGLPDGTYYLNFVLFENPFLSEDLEITTTPVPVTLSFNQELFSSGEFVFEGFDTASEDGEEAIIGTFKIENGYLYTVSPLADDASEDGDQTDDDGEDTNENGEGNA